MNGVSPSPSLALEEDDTVEDLPLIAKPNGRARKRTSGARRTAGGGAGVVKRPAKKDKDKESVASLDDEDLLLAEQVIQLPPPDQNPVALIDERYDRHG